MSGSALSAPILDFTWLGLDEDSFRNHFPLTSFVYWLIYFVILLFYLFINLFCNLTSFHFDIQDNHCDRSGSHGAWRCYQYSNNTKDWHTLQTVTDLSVNDTKDWHIFPTVADLSVCSLCLPWLTSQYVVKYPVKTMTRILYKILIGQMISSQH